MLTPAQQRVRTRQQQQQQQQQQLQQQQQRQPMLQEPLWMDTFVTEAYSFAALASLMPPALKARCMQWPRLLVAEKRMAAQAQSQERASVRDGV